jgi:hypothetical protein
MRVNWTAIAVAAVADWLLGAVWFTVFAAQWRAGLRMTPEELQTYMSNPNFWPFLIALLCSAAMAYVIARMVAIAPSHGLFRGISAGILVGSATAAAMITEMAFEYRTGPFIMISAFYPLLGCILMGIIIGIWKPKSMTAAQMAK